MSKLKIKKGDKVIVLAGRDKGKSGEVKKVIPAESKVIVSGINLQTKHTKPSQLGPGGKSQSEAPIHVSNVALADPKSGKPTRVGYKISGDTKVRIAKKSGQQVE